MQPDEKLPFVRHLICRRKNRCKIKLWDRCVFYGGKMKKEENRDEQLRRRKMEHKKVVEDVEENVVTLDEQWSLCQRRF